MGRRKYNDFETMIYKGVSEGIREIQRARNLDDKSMAEDVFHKAESTFRGYKYMATGLDIVDFYQLCNNENVCLDRLIGLRKEFNLFRDSSNVSNPADLIVELAHMGSDPYRKCYKCYEVCNKILVDKELLLGYDS